MFDEPVTKVLNIDHKNLKAYSTGLLQGRAYRVLNGHLTKSLLPYDLSIPEWKMLGLLSERGPMKLAEIAELLGVEAPLVTKLVDQLEKKKFVGRANDPSDRRAKTITIAKKGATLIPELEVVVKKKMAELLHGTSPQDLRTYLKVLETLVDNG